MIATTKIRPARRFGAGYFIREQLELREWNQQEFAEITGFTQKHISDILNDKKPVSLDMARILGEVFDTSAQYWLNLDNSYRLWLQEEPTEKEKKADTKAKIYERMPVRDMVKKGWLPRTKTTEELVKTVCDFWGTSDLDFSEMDQSELCLTKKSEAFNQFNAYYALTWYKKAQIEAARLEAPKYNESSLVNLLEAMHAYTVEEENIGEFLEKLTQTGVKVLVLPHLEKTYLDGAAFYDHKNPVVIYTGRYKRIDNFWFTLAHELAHVLLHLNEKTPFILDDLKNRERYQMEMEQQANELAGIHLKHPEVYDELKPNLGYLTTANVEAVAGKYHVHPSIIIGKLAFEDKISHRHLHLYNKINVLDFIPGKYKVLGE